MPGSNDNSINPQLTEEELRRLREIEEAKNNPNVTPTEENETPTGEGETPTVITPTSPTPAGVAPTVATPVTPVTPVTPTASEKKYKSYDDVLELLKGKIETDEEKKARERREKSRAMVNSIADAGRALANMWGATQYAPSSYDATKDSLSEKYQAKLEAERKKRDANRDWWLNYALNMSKLKASDRANEQAQANWETQMEETRKQNAQKQKNWEAEKKMKEGEYELRAKKLQWQMDLDQGKLDLQKAKLELDEMYKKGKLSLEQKELEEKKLEHDYKIHPYTETTTIERDENGREVSRTKKREVGNTGSGGESGGKTGSLLHE